MRGCRFFEFQCRFPPVLTRCGEWRISDEPRPLLIGVGQTFSIYGEIDLGDFAVEAEDGTEVGLHDVASKVVHDNDLCVIFFRGAIFHVDIDIGHSSW